MIKHMLGDLHERKEHEYKGHKPEMQKMREEIADDTARKATHFLANSKKFRGGY